MRLNRRASDASLLPVVHTVIVKASSGPRYVVGCRSKLDKSKLVQGTRVALDMTTLTIMRALPREARHFVRSLNRCAGMDIRLDFSTAQS